jgi:hypothetical protein
MTRVELSPIVLPESLGLRRASPIAPEDRSPDHDARFDALTLVYDAVHLADSGRVRLYCPPPLDLLPVFREAEFRLDGRPVRLRRLRRCRRYATAELDAPDRPARLSVTWRGWTGETPVASDADCAPFAGRNVLLTLSRDNPLDWIADWARFHAAEHGANAVLFLDNGSTAYPPQALADTLASVPGIEVVRVAVTDRPYGPLPLRGSKSRAMFLQTALLNLARARWLWRARAVLQCDVDELVVSRDGASVFDATAASRAGWIKFRGLWRAPMGDPEAMPRHADHYGVLDDAKPCPAKYCIVPAGRMRRHSWNVHNLDLVPFSGRFETDAFHYLHCRGITTRWKGEKSRNPLTARPADEAAQALLARVFGGA